LSAFEGSEFSVADRNLSSSSVDVSICILNWNGSKMLSDCLQSLRDILGLNRSGFEIIVIDNGSTDDSVGMVRATFPDVRLVTIPKNIGISAATNEGLRHASGRYSLILNNDIVLHGDCLDRMVQFLDRNAKAGVVGARLLNSDGSTQVNYYPRRLPSVGSIFAELFWLRRNSNQDSAQWNPDVACQMDQVPGACMMVRGEVFKQIGFWDAEFSCWYEDVDFCNRCLQAGWEIWYLPEARVVHYGGSTFQGLGMSQKTLWRFHGLLRYCAKHFSWARYTLVRISVFLALLVRLPVVAALRFSPTTEVRRTWRGIVPAYLKLIGKLSG
jgi:N-acetylglucosaminyl-diphospho-decaprenol L-rhamnosyltransferase